MTPFVSGLPVSRSAPPRPARRRVVTRGRRRRSAYSSASKPPCGFASAARASKGLKIAVQGLGGVGYPLCRLLAAEGASLLRSGLAARCRAAGLPGARARRRCPRNRFSRRTWMSCRPALSARFSTARSIPTVRARVIAGAANNQLAREEDGEALMRAGILYAPDYVINAGGIISVAHEYRGGRHRSPGEGGDREDPRAAHGDFRARPPRRSADERDRRSDG